MIHHISHLASTLLPYLLLSLLFLLPLWGMLILAMKREKSGSARQTALIVVRKRMIGTRPNDRGIEVCREKRIKTLFIGDIFKTGTGSGNGRADDGPKPKPSMPKLPSEEENKVFYGSGRMRGRL